MYTVYILTLHVHSYNIGDFPEGMLHTAQYSKQERRTREREKAKGSELYKKQCREKE